MTNDFTRSTPPGDEQRESYLVAPGGVRTITLPAPDVPLAIRDLTDTGTALSEEVQEHPDE